MNMIHALLLVGMQLGQRDIVRENPYPKISYDLRSCETHACIDKRTHARKQA